MNKSDISKCLHEVFEQRVAENPAAVALEFNGATLSYLELNRQANRLAHYLREIGVGPAVNVGVCLERSFEMVVALLAILKAGGTYVPLDPTYPQSRLDFMIEDSGLKLLLVNPHLWQNFNSTLGLQPLLLDATTLEQLTAQRPDHDLALELSPEQVAYINYTSGSTGKPKGSLIPHRSVYGYMFGADYATFDANQVFLHYSSPSWDVLTLEVWSALLNGARCVIFRPGSIAPEALAEIIETAKISTLWLTSSLFNLFVDNYLHALRPVRQLLTGGEALSLQHVQRALAGLPETQIVNGYGPSECTVFACCYRMPATLPPQLKSVPIGKPIGDRAVYILDKNMKRVAFGVVGELYIGGPAVAKGYLNQPELTAQKFVENPFAKEPGALLYRTGDLVRIRPDGLLEFVGRVDNQIKLRGYRIELDEIEVVLRRLPGVREAAVVVKEDRTGNKRLVAYMTAGGGATLSDEKLRQTLQTELPDYMIPSNFVTLEQMPLTANSKLDRARLAALELVEESAESTETLSPTEEKLAALWQELLGVKQLTRGANFFHLGGHSLLAIQLLTLIKQNFAIELGLETIFVSNTLAALAQEIEAVHQKNNLPVSTISRASRQLRELEVARH